MLIELRLLILTTTLISFSHETTADIIVQPGYGKAGTQYPFTIYPQPLVTPVQRHQLRASEFGPTHAELVPIYANGHQGGASYRVGDPMLHYHHYPHYPRYPHYVHVLPRYAPQRHLRVLKIGGHKVFQPSWFVGQPAVPLTVHRRFKKSVEEQPDSGKSGENAFDSTNSPLDPLSADIEETEDKHIETRQSKNDRITTATLFDLNPALFINSQEPKAKSSNPSERNTGVNTDSSIKKDSESEVEKSSTVEPTRTDAPPVESNLLSSTDQPNFRNFPDPRPHPIKHKKLHRKKSMLKNAPENTTESDEEDTSIVGSTKMEGETSPNYAYHQPPLYATNFLPPTAEYQPFYIVRYGNCADGTPKAFDGQQSPSHRQIHQVDATTVTNFQPSMEYAYWPQNHDYVSSYVLGYPGAPYYVSSPYPITYAQYK